jgi:hypothetical protein
VEHEGLGKPDARQVLNPLPSLLPAGPRARSKNLGRQVPYDNPRKSGLVLGARLTFQLFSRTYKNSKLHNLGGIHITL